MASGVDEFVEGGSLTITVPITPISFLALLHPMVMVTSPNQESRDQWSCQSTVHRSLTVKRTCRVLHLTPPPHTHRQPQMTRRQVQVVQVYFSNTSETYKSSAFLSSPMDQTTVEGRRRGGLDMLGSCSWSLVKRLLSTQHELGQY